MQQRRKASTPSASVRGGGRATEAQCQKAIFEAAKRIPGWLIHHGHPAPNGRGRFLTPIQGKPGFVDLTMIHPRRGIALFIELKRYPNAVEPDQLDWLLAMRSVGLDARIWWVPEDLDELLAVVAGSPLPPARPLVDMLAGPSKDPRRSRRLRMSTATAVIESHPLGPTLLEAER